MGESGKSSKRGAIVGAGLVPALVGVLPILGCANEGRHKTCPYERFSTLLLNSCGVIRFLLSSWKAAILAALMTYDSTIPVTPGPSGRLKVSPTDVSQFIRLEQCRRYLRLR